ncbi:MAG: chorismate--pyruvate lyase [Clostridium sp.]|nr:chorismate--pyruvate lyase [Clostridium sp.]
MIPVNYIVMFFDGDYVVLKDDNNNENKVAIALLPEGIKVGTKLLFENFEYRII